MTKDLKKKLLDRVNELDAFKIGDFTLSSGAKSKFYFDGRSLTLDGTGANLIAKIFLKELLKTEVQFIGGPATAAIPIIASLASLAKITNDINLQGFYVRSKPKEHGLTRSIEGNLKKHSRVIIIDDTLTTGGSLLEAINEVEKQFCEIVSTYTVFDRNEGGKQNLENKGFSNFSIIKYDEKSNSLII
ncbi:MAG: orotate phosphoribosyltransferase [Chloroflexota bacterium]|tara:strand:- start:223 stop:786 length:564 start_codon:yes stop_codon:yes gene_type:complete